MQSLAGQWMIWLVYPMCTLLVCAVVESGKLWLGVELLVVELFTRLCAFLSAKEAAILDTRDPVNRCGLSVPVF
jgi:hypothetical protein